jgi:hypothetical protein
MAEAWDKISLGYWRKLLLISESGSKDCLVSKTGSLDFYSMADGYERIVIGQRGPYVELTEEQIVACKSRLFVPDKQQWRLSPSWINKIYYIEYRHDPTQIMVYFQKKTVSYADYKVGMYYISPWDLVTETNQPLIKSNKPSWHY